MKGIKSPVHLLLREEQAMADLLSILTIEVERLPDFATCMESLVLLWIYMGAELESNRIKRHR